MRRDILPAVNDGASHARTALRWVGNLGFPARRASGSATPPLLLSGVQDGHGDSELSCCFVSVLLSTGLLFDEANTESTASLWTAEIRWESIVPTSTDARCGHSYVAFPVVANRAPIHPTTQVVGFLA